MGEIQLHLVLTAPNLSPWELVEVNEFEGEGDIMLWGTDLRKWGGEILPRKSIKVDKGGHSLQLESE